MRLGFLGLGWIGLNRMRSLVELPGVEIAALADSSKEALERASSLAPEATRCITITELLEQQLDGLVIATPSALHAQQTILALQSGLPVFCQKPLARDSAESRRVLEAARKADRLLGVDLSYRHTAGLQRVRQVVSEGALGDLFYARLVFHNAYGPDKDWYYDRRQSGGGCVADLGLHLVDSLLWLTDFPRVERVRSRLLRKGRPVTSDQVEDFACAHLELVGGLLVDLACSWNLHAGHDVEITVELYGTRGGARFGNINGSYYDFQAELFHGTGREVLTRPPDDWGPRALLEWVRRLEESPAYRPAIEEYARVAELLDLMAHPVEVMA